MITAARAFVFTVFTLLISWVSSHTIAFASYPPDPRTDTNWDYSHQKNIRDIENQFNRARANENTQNGCSLPPITFPDQRKWNSMSDNEKALWMINDERRVRNLELLDRTEESVISVAQYFAGYLMKTETFDHLADGRSPWERLDSIPEIHTCSEFLRVAENLAVFWSGTTFPIEQAVYMWLYADSGSNWGHRHTILWDDYNDNSGPSGREGFLGIGRATGRHQGYPNAEIVVMNVFDPCPSWN